MHPALACSSTLPTTLHLLPCVSLCQSCQQHRLVQSARLLNLLSLLGSESLLLTVQCFLSGSEQPCFSLPCSSGLITRDPCLGFHLLSCASPVTLGRADRKCLLPHIPAPFSLLPSGQYLSGFPFVLTLFWFLSFHRGRLKHGGSWLQLGGVFGRNRGLCSAPHFLPTRM